MMPERANPVCEAISSIMLGALVVVLHMMGAKVCFLQASFSRSGVV